MNEINPHGIMFASARHVSLISKFSGSIALICVVQTKEIDWIFEQISNNFQKVKVIAFCGDGAEAAHDKMDLLIEDKGFFDILTTTHNGLDFTDAIRDAMDLVSSYNFPALLLSIAGNYSFDMDVIAGITKALSNSFK